LIHKYNCFDVSLLWYKTSLTQLQVGNAPDKVVEELASLKQVEKAHSSIEQSTLSTGTVTSIEKVSTLSSVQTTSVQSAVQAAQVQESVSSSPSPYHAADFCIPVGPDFSLVSG
jgi:hypothetical protein